MKHIANLLFEARILKEAPRSGYHFLGTGKESIAEHSFITTFIAWIMSQTEPDVNGLRLISMCLVHDLPEARTGDLNAVQKQYVKADEKKAIADLTKHLPFGTTIVDLTNEFNEGKTREAQLAHDADQLAFIIDLKAQKDLGITSPVKWLPHVLNRLKTDTGKKIAEEINHTEWDEWWLKNFVDG
jgi:5'-deoxynucleotidase YfbR-like HD superfamily hydrolase